MTLSLTTGISKLDKWDQSLVFLRSGIRVQNSHPEIFATFVGFKDLLSVLEKAFLERKSKEVEALSYRLDADEEIENYFLKEHLYEEGSEEQCIYLVALSLVELSIIKLVEAKILTDVSSRFYHYYEDPVPVILELSVSKKIESFVVDCLNNSISRSSKL